MLSVHTVAKQFTPLEDMKIPKKFSWDAVSTTALKKTSGTSMIVSNSTWHAARAAAAFLRRASFSSSVATIRNQVRSTRLSDSTFKKRRWFSLISRWPFRLDDSQPVRSPSLRSFFWVESVDWAKIRMQSSALILNRLTTKKWNKIKSFRLHKQHWKWSVSETELVFFTSRWLWIIEMRRLNSGQRLQKV